MTDKKFQLYYYDKDDEWADCSNDYDTKAKALAAARVDARDDPEKWSRIEVVEVINRPLYEVTSERRTVVKVEKA